jgi:hypothetical protein
VSPRAWIFAIAVLSLTLAAPASAKRFFVPGGYTTVQAAVNAASTGDTVWVAAGTYAGGIVMKKSLVLFGDAGAENTILDGGDSVRVLHIEGVKSAAILGFTIRRGKANSGGGVHCVRDTSLLFAGCVFQKNWESAISTWESSDINVRECLFEENTGSALAVQSSTVVLGMCEFNKNQGYVGGAISLVQSRLLLPIRNCSFSENRSDATGGAINLDASEALLGELDFQKNTAKVAGGAVACMNGSKLAVSRSRFWENRAAGSGAIHTDRSGINIGGSLFVKNGASALGSTVGIVGRATAGINPIITNNTFYLNASDSEGSVIWAEHVSPDIKKNIFVIAGGQRVAAGIQSSPLYECNLLHDPTGKAPLPTADTLVGDPLFCDAENGNFYLRDLSPAVLAACAPIGALPKKCTSFKMAPSK